MLISDVLATENIDYFNYSSNKMQGNEIRARKESKATIILYPYSINGLFVYAHWILDSVQNLLNFSWTVSLKKDALRRIVIILYWVGNFNFKTELCTVLHKFFLLQMTIATATLSSTQICWLELCLRTALGYARILQDIR